MPESSDVECRLLDSNLKDEILKEHKLKPTEASEKNILPSAEDLSQEKTHQSMLSGKSYQHGYLHLRKSKLQVFPSLIKTC